MGALRMVFRAELRRRGRSWLVIAVLVGVVGGLVLAASAAGRRTDSAFPRFVAAHGFDAAVYALQPLPGLAKLPGVSAATEMFGPFNGQPACRCTHPLNPTDFGVIEIPPGGRSAYKLVSGHTPDPAAPDQVLASFTLQQDYGFHLGSVIRVPFYSRSQATAYNNATGALPAPAGPTTTFRVVGFEASEFEFPSGTTPSYDLYTTPAFARAVLPRTAFGYVYLVKLRSGAAGIPRLDAEVNAMRSAGVAGSQNEDQQIASVEASIHPQAIGWWILAALATLVGMAVLGQALARQSLVESEESPTLAALGVDRRQLVMLGMARSLVVALAGAAGAVAVAVALSPVAPLGEARLAQSTTGVSFDALVLPLGALGTVAVVLLLGLWPAIRAAGTLRFDSRRTTPIPSAVVARLASMGVPPSVVVGVRNALQRRSGGSTVPVGSALLGTVLAVIALCGTAVFGASLSHLTATPKLYGDDFQLNFTNPGGGPPDARLLRSLEGDRRVTGITEGIAIAVSIGRTAVGAIAGTPIRGPLLLSAVDGHLPSGSGQIGLGAATMREVGAHVGSNVPVTLALPSGAKRTAPFRVVSEISFPVLGGAVSLGTGAALTIPGYQAAVCPTSQGQAACRQSALETSNGGGILASFVSGPRGQAAINHYLDTYQTITAVAITPTSLVNFGEAVNFPLIFGAMLGVFGAATLTHLLVVSVARRRREIGLLKVLGFVNGQVASAVAWQATTFALVGIVIGVPLGLVAGQVVWRAFALNMGAVPVAVVPTGLLVALGAAVLVVANLLAVLPALAATRSRPGDLLRTQ
jgi:hypothetical protein